MLLITANSFKIFEVHFSIVKLLLLKKIFNAEFFFSKAWLRNSKGDIRKCIHLEEGEELKITELKNKKELVCTMKQK